MTMFLMLFQSKYDKFNHSVLREYAMYFQYKRLALPDIAVGAFFGSDNSPKNPFMLESAV